MDIFEFAMQMEKDGEAYYRELAAKAGNKGLSNILTMLADEEVKHYNIFQKMKESKVEVPDSDLLGNVKNIFIQMKERGDTFLFEAEQTDYYRKALDLEKKSENFYRDKANETTDTHQKAIFNKIANEENHHFRIVENIIDFIQRPEKWLEGAEWYHLEDY